MALVDLENAYENANWAKFFKIMENDIIDYNNRRIICYNLYINKTAIIRVEKGNNQDESKSTTDITSI